VGNEAGHGECAKPRKLDLCVLFSRWERANSLILSGTFAVKAPTIFLNTWLLKALAHIKIKIIIRNRALV
jgi:hypothetical protein